MANAKPAEIARVERSIFSAKSLFAERPKWAGKAPERKFFRFDKGNSLEVQMPAPLGSFHLLVLMAIIAEAQTRMVWEKPGGADQLGREMRKALGLNEKAAASPNLTLAVSYYAFAASLGRSYAFVLKRQIDEALADLAGTRLIWGNGEACNLLAFKKFPIDGGEPALRISLCPALSEVIKNQRPYTRVSMDEARNLKCLTTILLHGWLSSIIPPGAIRPINLDTLLEDVVWAQKTDKGSSTWRSRKAALLRKLLPDLENAGWKWNFDPRKDQVRFKRPPLNDEAEKKSGKIETGPELSMSM